MWTSTRALSRTALVAVCFGAFLGGPALQADTGPATALTPSEQTVVDDFFLALERFRLLTAEGLEPWTDEEWKDALESGIEARPEWTGEFVR